MDYSGKSNRMLISSLQSAGVSHKCLMCIFSQQSTRRLKKVAKIIMVPKSKPKLGAEGLNFARDITWERLILLSLSKERPKKYIL